MLVLTQAGHVQDTETCGYRVCCRMFSGICGAYCDKLDLKTLECKLNRQPKKDVQACKTQSNRIHA